MHLPVSRSIPDLMTHTYYNSICTMLPYKVLINIRVSVFGKVKCHLCQRELRI